ncbi:hypothetical protein CYMTET_31939 [Cymbomonas tetramitiformis]|uniref:Uncharacterized protein n=1 Tax=Cymbomonas tetramitiformis TaxID=36881 RepID=A0AAE0FFT1_9CHLO|nr:hypothetical protein CYMTET_31939 [Cymbomonas tetramitiformis]|eukprot:gene15636-18541_t
MYEEGIFVYRVLSPLEVRSQPSTGDDVRAGGKAFVDALFAVDLKQSCRIKNSNNGPFLRLTNGSGWLFERKDRAHVMESIPVERGLWAYRINNPGHGLALRSRPSSADDTKLQPEFIFPHNDLVWADCRVVFKGLTYVRIQGTGGWLFGSRNGSPTLILLPPEQPSVGYVYVADNYPVRCHELNLPEVRECARRHGLDEIQFNERSRVIAFSDRARTVRINVYYTTGTVGTCVSHPKQGSTQMFRRSCTMHLLEQIMMDPRVHTGKGYKRKFHHAMSVDHRDERKYGGEIAGPARSEDLEVRYQLLELDKEASEIAEQRAALSAHINALDANRLERAEAERVEREREASAKLEKENVEKEKKRLAAVHEAAVRARQEQVNRDHARGNYSQSWLSYRDYMPQSMSNVKCVGINEGGYVAVYDEGSCAYHGVSRNITEYIDRQENSNISYLAIGPDSQFFGKKFNGKTEWNAPGDFGEAIHQSSSGVKFVAFGPFGTYYIQFLDGSTHWNGEIDPTLDQYLMQSSNIRQVWLGEDEQYFICWDCGGFDFSLRPEHQKNFNKMKKLARTNCIRQFLIWEEDHESPCYFLRCS